MKLRPSQRHMLPRRPTDRGFTLIELLIAIVLGGVIAGVTVAALATSMNIAKSTTDEVNDSVDAGLISAFFFRDAQSAGGVDPTTARDDTSLGVSNDPSDTAGVACANLAPPVATLTLVVRFSWIDRTPASPTTTAVIYALDTDPDDATKLQLTRRTCTSGTPVDVVLARHLVAAVATCSPGPTCLLRPTSVSLQITGTGAQAPLTLTASLRGTDMASQAEPQSTNSSPVALIALRRSGPCPNLTLSGTDTVTVIGDVLVDGTCGAAPITDPSNKLSPIAPGTKSAIAGITDPFAGRQQPTVNCTGTNPAQIGKNPGLNPDTVISYPQPVTINEILGFDPGHYVFCNGLDIQSGAVVTGTGVLLYVRAGALIVATNATVDLAASLTGADANLLIWVPASNPETITIAGGARVNNLRGVIYAPASTLALSSVVAANIGGAIVKDVTITGPGAARIGLPIPVQSISPSSIPAGEVGVVYAADLTTSGGTPSSTWTASGLPPGVAINASTGKISGTPTLEGPYAIVVTAFDATKAAVSKDYAITVAPLLTISTTSPLPGGQMGVIYSATVTSAGGTAAYAWSATGLPAGLTINGTSGVISGTPTASGTFNASVAVTDAMSATATKTFAITVADQLTVSGPVSLPAGKVGVVYPSTTVSSGGGTAAYAWSATGLPPGLTINGSSGVISGTPTAAGSFSPVVTVTDARLATATKTFAITVDPAAVVPPGCPATTTGWQGEYYSNRTLTAPSTLCRDDPNPLAFNWGGGAPASGMPVDNFSVRWTRTQDFAAGSYTFTLGSDDGTRLFIDGVPVSGPNNWTDHAYPTPQPTYTTSLSAGSHTIVVEYYEAGGASQVSLTWSYNVPASCPFTITGWRGEYYSNTSLTGSPTVCRDDPNPLTFNWGTGAPAPSVPADNFSVRWTRTQNFTSGSYVFALGSDDGGRLYIDGVLVIDRWVDQGYPTPQPTYTTSLSAGDHTLMIEYYERGGDARATLTWNAAPAGANGVAVTASSQRGQNDGVHNLSMTNSAVITNLSVTIAVRQTAGLTYGSQWTNFWTSPAAVTSANSGPRGGFIYYTFNIIPGQTIVAGSWQMYAQWLESGTIHPTTGDTWSVTSTSSGITTTLTGTF